MRHSKSVFWSLLFAGIMGGLIGASPAMAQTTSPFTGKRVTVTTGDDAYDPSATVASTTDADILTDEEKELMALKLLPSYYPHLKEAMQGKSGSLEKAKARARGLFNYKNALFSRHFGEPPAMLEWARRYRDDQAMVKLIAAMKRGDILLSGPGSEEAQKKDMICVLTNGRFHHAVVIIDTPPCVFIEAMGITGLGSDDTSVNHVRICAWHDQLGNWMGMRLIRPTAGLPPAEASRCIEGAVNYAVLQLGKPYDYGFTNSDATRAYYCSELAYKAYHDGAKLKSFKPATAPKCGKMVVAITSMVDGLKPKDRLEMGNKIIIFASSFAAKQPPDLKALNDFIVDDVAPNCDIFSDAFPSAESREKLRSVLEKVRNNKAFPKYIAARESFLASKKSGKFDAGWGIGAARKLAAEVKIAAALASDMNGLVRESGAGYAKLAKLVGSIIAPLYRNMGTYAGFLTGMNDEGRVNLPEGAKTVLSMTDWLTEKRESIKKWPVGSGLANLLPGNGDEKAQGDFTSPSDLAESSPNFHVDYP